MLACSLLAFTVCIWYHLRFSIGRRKCLGLPMFLLHPKCQTKSNKMFNSKSKKRNNSFQLEPLQMWNICVEEPQQQDTNNNDDDDDNDKVLLINYARAPVLFGAVPVPSAITLKLNAKSWLLFACHIVNKRKLCKSSYFFLMLTLPTKCIHQFWQSFSSQKFSDARKFRVASMLVFFFYSNARLRQMPISSIFQIKYFHYQWSCCCCCCWFFENKIRMQTGTYVGCCLLRKPQHVRTSIWFNIHV